LAPIKTIGGTVVAATTWQDAPLQAKSRSSKGEQGWGVGMDLPQKAERGHFTKWYPLNHDR